jgi:hypothetical protein
MEPTVLAGPIEFSPAEIAAILAVLAGLFVVLTSPGWGLVAYAFHRRRAARGPGSTWPAAVGGALVGLAVSAGAAALIGGLARSVGGGGFVLVVLAAWAACGALSLLLLATQTRAAQTGSDPRPGSQGWGR